MYKILSDISIRLEAIATELRENMGSYYDFLDPFEIEELMFVLEVINDAVNTVGVIAYDK